MVRVKILYCGIIKAQSFSLNTCQRPFCSTIILIISCFIVILKIQADNSFFEYPVPEFVLYEVYKNSLDVIVITYKKAIPSDFETLASICIEAMRPDLRKRDPYDLEQLDIIESEQLDGPELEQTDEINSEQFDIMDSAQTDTYDPEQERERFKKSFVPDLTIVSLFHEQITGFYMMTEEKDRIVVNHLCVDPQFQNNGFGTQMMKRIIAKYNQTYKPIYVEVPRNSKANVFFQRHGFKMIKELESSIIYVFPF